MLPKEGHVLSCMHSIGGRSFHEKSCTWLVGARSQKIKVEEVEPQSLPELLCKTLQDMQPAHTRMTPPVSIWSTALRMLHLWKLTVESMLRMLSRYDSAGAADSLHGDCAGPRG